MTEERIFGESGWIWPVNHHWDIVNGYALFRKTLTLSKVPEKAPLFITADQSYRLFINGRFISRGPARGFQRKWPYDQIDISAYLKRGANILAIRAYNPGCGNFQYISEGFAGLLVAAQWGSTKITSDASWKCIRQVSATCDTAPTSMQLFFQEHIDLRKENGDWTSEEFDDSEWLTPVSKLWNGAPWFSLEPRGIPLLVEEPWPMGKLVGVRKGTSAQGYERVRNVIELRSREDRGHDPVEGAGGGILTKDGDPADFQSYLFDFGTTVVGNLQVEIEGALGDEIIDTHYVETVDAATLIPDYLPDVTSRMAFGDRLICRQGNTNHHFYHHQGFRFVEVTIRNSSVGFHLRFKLNWTGYPLAPKGSFASSDADLEKLWKTCAWTQQCCSLDAYVDTPWREQAQWWGDARVQGINTFYINGDARLFRRGIGQIASQLSADGIPYSHAPTIGHECIIPDFSIIWLLTLWDYYWQTGSLEAFNTHHAQVQSSLGYFKAWTDPKSGLLINDPKYWLFLDWTEIFKDGMPTLYSLWLLLALEKLAILYGLSGNSKESKRLKNWEKSIRGALKPLVNKNGLLRDGIDRKGKIVSDTSIHAQTLAIEARLKSVDENAAIKEILLPYIAGESKPKTVPSAYWHTYIFDVLTTYGYEEDVLRFIKEHWTPMSEHGTTWEIFKPRLGEGSCSHAWSAHPSFHLMRTIGGIRQTAAGWIEISFKPTFYGERARTTVPTPKGPVTSEWKRNGQHVEVTLDMPPGMRAQVELPGIRPQEVTTSGNWRVASPSWSHGDDLVTT